jgi:hypothetical protein
MMVKNRLRFRPIGASAWVSPAHAAGAARDIAMPEFAKTPRSSREHNHLRYRFGGDQ